MLDRARGHLGGHFRRHHELYWAPLLYAVAVVWIYRAVFLAGGPQMGLGWDTIEGYWPDLAYLGDRIRHGQWPLWNPFERGGYPDIAMPERGFYYPLNWLFAGAGALIGHVPWWIGQLKGFAHHFLAALLMHVYLRRRGLPRPAAAVGGLAWLASAPLLIHKASSVIWPMVWVPVLWLASDAVCERPGWRRGVLLGGAVGLAGHAGSAPGFFYALLLALPYGAVRAGQALWTLRRDRARLRRHAGRLGLALGLAAAITVALLAVTVVPSWELTALSQRAQRSVAYALEFPLPVAATLRGLVAPAAGGYDMYVGILVLALATIAVAAAPRRDRGAPILFAVLAVLFLVLAFGSATPLLGFLVRHVPGFDLFRASNRYKLLVAPLLAALAGHGAAVLLEAVRGRRPTRVQLTCAAVIAVLAALVAWAVLAGHLRGGKVPSRWLPLGLIAVAAVLVAGALLLPRRWAALVVAAMAVPVVWEPQHVVHFSNKALERRVDDQEDRGWLEGLDDVTREWRIWDEFVLEQRAGSRLAVREMRSYPAGGSLETERYRLILRYAEKHPEILPVFSVRYFFHRGHHRAGMTPNHFKRPLDQIAPRHFRRMVLPRCERDHIRTCPVFEATRPVAAVAWYGAAEVDARGGGKLLDVLRRQIDADTGELRTAALEPAAAARLDPPLLTALLVARAAPPPSVTGRVLSLEANTMEVEIDAPAAGLVVVNDAMYPGWQAEVDGHPATLVYANWWSRGVPVDAGHHRIRFVFRPAHHRLHAWLFSLALLLVLAAALLPRRSAADHLPVGGDPGGGGGHRDAGGEAAEGGGPAAVGGAAGERGDPAVDVGDHRVEAGDDGVGGGVEGELEQRREAGDPAALVE